VAEPGLVGLHGDGLGARWVTCAVVALVTTFVDVLACFRRFWCPACHRGCLVGHPGIVPRIRASLPTVAAAVRAVAAAPLGDGLGEIEVQEQVRGGSVAPPISELARSGKPRWHTLRRWVRTLERWWPTLTFLVAGFRARAAAFVAGIGPGLAIEAFLEAAVQAQLRGAAAM